jgi:hypothetical protein
LDGKKSSNEFKAWQSASFSNFWDSIVPPGHEIDNDRDFRNFKAFPGYVILHIILLNVERTHAFLGLGDLNTTTGSHADVAQLSTRDNKAQYIRSGLLCGPA